MYSCGIPDEVLAVCVFQSCYIVTCDLQQAETCITNFLQKATDEVCPSFGTWYWSSLDDVYLLVTGYFGVI